MTVPLVTVVELIRRSDIVTLHCPPSTDGPVISADLLRGAKPGVILINTARSTLVDDDAVSPACAVAGSPLRR